jgi:hypothetical protein
MEYHTLKTDWRTVMRASLHADSEPIELKPFVEKFLANVAKAVIQSLKGTEGATKAVFTIKGKKMEIQIDGRPLDLHMDRGFAEVISRDTILGATSHLRGMRGHEEIRLEVEL